jgi:micrococcal nuclease
VRIPKEIGCALLLVLLAPCICRAWQGKVVGVTDGDTITALRDGKREMIRLYGVDSPDKGQVFGQNAKQFTMDMVLGKNVDVREVPTEQYGGKYGIVSVDGAVLNGEIVKAGYAWVYKQYCTRKECAEWSRLEDEARNRKLGLWVLSVAIPPWEFRRYRAKGMDHEDGEKSVVIYHGDVVTHVFHAPGCEDFNCKNCIAVFKTREAAIRAGYKPCGKCNP